MQHRFQKYMRAPWWFSKTAMFAETGRHFIQCCYATSFSKVHASPSTTFKNHDYSRERLTFSSMLLCKSFKSTCEPLNDLKDYVFCWEGLTCSSMPLCDIISKRTCEPPQWLPKAMIIAERGWDLPQCRYATSFPKVHASPSMTLKSNDYSWERVTFSSMLLRKIVFKSTCEPLNDSQKQWFPD